MRPTFKAKLGERDKRLTCHMLTIPSATVAQAVAASGADSIMVDLEHGAIDHAAAQAMIAATQGFDCAPLVRIPEISVTHVKRALDLGAEGICFPLVRSVADAELAVASLRYPPDGIRSFGPFVAQSRWGMEFAGYVRDIAPHMVCMLLIETVEAVACVEKICAGPGIDLIVPARFDLSCALGKPGQFDDPEFLDMVARVERAATAAGIPLGQVCRSRADAEAHFGKGYRVIAGFDLLWLRAAAEEMQGWTRR